MYTHTYMCIYTHTYMCVCTYIYIYIMSYKDASQTWVFAFEPREGGRRTAQDESRSEFETPLRNVLSFTGSSNNECSRC